MGATMIVSALLLYTVSTAAGRRVRPREPKEPSPRSRVDKLTADLSAGPPVRPCEPADPDKSGCDAEEKNFIERVSICPA